MGMDFYSISTSVVNIYTLAFVWLSFPHDGDSALGFSLLFFLSFLPLCTSFVAMQELAIVMHLMIFSSFSYPFTFSWFFFFFHLPLDLVGDTSR